MQGDGNCAADPAAYSRETAAGVIMPLSVTTGARLTPWEETDEPLTLTHKAGSVSTRYTLTRGEWVALLPHLLGRDTIADLASAAEAGAAVPSGPARVKLAGLIDLAGGRAAVVRLACADADRAAA